MQGYKRLRKVMNGRIEKVKKVYEGLAKVRKCYISLG